MAKSVQIAVLDPLPLFRRGTLEVLSDVGFEPKGPDDLLAWIRQAPQRVVILTLESPTDWLLLNELVDASPRALVIAVLSDVATSTYVRAILGGAATAIPRDAPPEVLRQAFEAAVDGKSLLPLEVIRELSVQRAPEERAGEDKLEALSPHEIEWLQTLARGRTVAQLAARAGYSERAMFRLLRALYTRMGVHNRTEAIIRAHQQGWL